MASLLHLNQVRSQCQLQAFALQELLAVLEAIAYHHSSVDPERMEWALVADAHSEMRSELAMYLHSISSWLHRLR